MPHLLNASNAPYSYSYVPKVVYTNQVFPVTILVKHLDLKDPPNFEFDSLSLIQPIIQKPVKVINKNEAFFTFYFKALSNKDSLKIPPLAIWNNDHTYALRAKEIRVKNLPNEPKNFSGVLASNFRINSIRVNPYDEENNLVTVLIEATEANIEDMHIPNILDDGVENIKRDGAKVIANYYFIVPSTLKSIDFSYFNTIKKRYFNEQIAISSIKKRVDNSNLNPKELSFDKFKKYALIALLIIFLVLYLSTKDKLYIIVSVITFVLLVVVFIPKKSICIKEGALLYILPTNNSNISLRIDKQIERKVLNRYNKFNKIEYKNGVTGWIRDEDTCKD